MSDLILSPIYFPDVIQRSEQWDMLRLGIPTASGYSKIITPKTMKPSVSAEGYMDDLLAEWIFGRPLEDPESEYQSQWMKRGEFMEGQARAAYELARGVDVEKCGFILRGDRRTGASPDGLIGRNGILELKVPKPRVHVHYMRTHEIELDYFPQLQGLLHVSCREWVDVMSYCPPYPDVIIRVGRNEQYIKALSEALEAFLELLERAKEDMVKRYSVEVPKALPPGAPLMLENVDGEDVVEAEA